MYVKAVNGSHKHDSGSNGLPTVCVLYVPHIDAYLAIAEVAVEQNVEPGLR
jgi:hypothetical protein